MDGSTGVTAMDMSVLEDVTVRTPALEVSPEREAVMFAVPAATPVATPPGAIVAMAEFDEVQVTAAVSSFVVPSPKSPVAVNCCWLPATTEALVGATVK
jgi:hypothetical protein